MHMACCKQSSRPLHLFSAAAVVVLVILVVVCPGRTVGMEAHLHFYMHDGYTGPNRTAVQVVNGTGAPLKGAADVRFGDTVVMDDVLTEGVSPASRVVGRAQGFYVTATSKGEPAVMLSMNVLLTAGPYNGSGVVVMGRNDILAPVRELSVVGGTGLFRMARGYVLWKTASWRGKNAILELDVLVHA